MSKLIIGAAIFAAGMAVGYFVGVQPLEGPQGEPGPVGPQGPPGKAASTTKKRSNGGAS